jgi:hypothetical protein
MQVVNPSVSRATAPHGTAFTVLVEASSGPQYFSLDLCRPTAMGLWSMGLAPLSDGAYAPVKTFGAGSLL